MVKSRSRVVLARWKRSSRAYPPFNAQSSRAGWEGRTSSREVCRTRPGGADVECHRRRALRVRAAVFRERFETLRPCWTCRGFGTAHLLEYGSKSPRCPAAYLHIIELPKRYETETNCVLHGLHLELTRDLASHDGVYQGAERRRDADAVDRLHVAAVEPLLPKAENAWNGGHSLKARRDGHVEFGRHDVGEPVQGQRRTVAESSLRLPRAVVRPELPEDQVRTRRERKPSQAIDAAPLANPVADAHMVGMPVVSVASRLRLAGGEEPTLLRRHRVEPIFERVPRHGIVPLLTRGIILSHGRHLADLTATRRGPGRSPTEFEVMRHSDYSCTNL